MIETKQEVVLEPSANAHVFKASSVKTTELGDSSLALEVEGQGLVVHGEHGTFATESKHIFKFVQREVNPVTKLIQKAFD